MIVAEADIVPSSKLPMRPSAAMSASCALAWPTQGGDSRPTARAEARGSGSFEQAPVRSPRGLKPAALLGLGWVLVAGSATAWAQAITTRPAPRLTSLSRFAPEATGLFIEFERLDQVRDQLGGLGPGALLDLLAETPIASTNGAGPFVDWGEVLTANLGVSPATAFEQLFSQQVAMAAPEWNRWRDGVILLRLTDRKALSNLLGPGRVRRAARFGPRVKLYQTTAGLWVGTDDRFVALSQRGDEDPFYHTALELLAGRSTRSLARLAAFSDALRRLPPGYQGSVYFHRTSTPAAETAPSVADRLGRAFDRGVVGVYVNVERVDLIARCALSGPGLPAPRALAPIARLARLPQTTLLACATSFDLPRAYESLQQASATPRDGSPLGLLAGMLDLTEVEQDLIGALGSRAVVVWGQGPAQSSPLPQLALLIESKNSGQAAAALEHALGSLLGASNTVGGGTEAPFPVTHEEHLGAVIRQVRLDESLRDTPPDSLVSAFRGLVRPSFTALDGWLAVALTPEHLREIIEADRGLIPCLGDAPELAGTLDRWSQSAVLALGQPGWASQVIQEWLNASADAEGSLVARLLGLAGAAPEQTRALGIGMRVRQDPGRVFVVRVYPGTPAGGRLEPGDEIVGVDGRLLSLEEPNADLRRAVLAARLPQRIVLRVQRDASLIDVPVALGSPPASRSNGTVAQVLRQMARLGRGLHYAAFAEFVGRPDQYAAQLTLAFRGATEVEPHAQSK